MTTFKTLFRRLVSETRRRRRRFSRSKSFTQLRSRSQSPSTPLPPSDSFRCIGVMHESMLFDMYDQMYNAPIDQRPSLTLYEMWFRSLKHYNVALSQSQSQDDSVQCIESSASDTSSTLYKCTPNNSPHTPLKTIPHSTSSSLQSESLIKPSMREIVVDNEILMVELTRQR